MELQDTLSRIDRLEAGSDFLKDAVSDLRDALIVTAEIQRRQSEVQKTQAELLADTDARVTRLREETEETVARLREAVNEVADKLHAVIGFLDSLPRNPPAA